jgi:tetratricopeptide (TPR) repeat protein
VPFIRKIRPLVGKAAGGGRGPATVIVKGVHMTVITWIVSWMVGAVIALAAQAPVPARFDMLVRADFFAGFAGDQDRLARGMDACERALAGNPKHAEALVWHGAGLTFRGGMALQKGDAQTGMDLWGRGLGEMDQAVALEPDNIGVRIPRGAMLLQVTRYMQPPMAKPLIEKALTDYERTLEIQTASGVFASLGSHQKGELLFGLADGYARIGDGEKARTYFERIVKDAPESGQTARAREWMATGALPAGPGLTCVGCHK